MAHPHEPEAITQARHLLAGYDVVLCDIWGVIHDGVTAYPGANEALTRFRAGGGSVVLVSNAPMPAPTVARVLDDKGVVRTAWDRIVSSGDIALSIIRARGYRQVHQVGPPRRDKAFFAALDGPIAAIEAADAIAVTGLLDDRRETAHDYAPMLSVALRRGIPLICANPDLAVHVGAELLPCAGAIAALYEEMGGAVTWAGKPHPIAYDTALEAAAGLRGAPVARDRVLAIGDSIRTDLAAAAGAGVDALLIAAGLHRDEMIDAAGSLRPDRVAAALAASRLPARAVSEALRW